MASHLSFQGDQFQKIINFYKNDQLVAAITKEETNQTLESLGVDSEGTLIHERTGLNALPKQNHDTIHTTFKPETEEEKQE